MKRFLLLLLLVLTCFSAAYADSLPAGGAAPYAPVLSALSEDGLSYDDSSLSIRIEKDRAFDTNVYYTYVKLTDVSQLRTALSAAYPSKTRRPVNVMAEENNAVLAINGDFFSYHSKGVVVRGGEILRQQPERARDTLIINEQGDFVFLTRNTRPEWESYRDSGAGLREAFCFGPALIIDGVTQKFDYRKKVSCGAPTPAQRTAICQMGPLEYMIFMCEGPEQEGQKGLSLAQVVELLEQKGVQQAYNLDGGSSSTLWLCGNRINSPETKYRPVGDIIYFATTVNSAE